MSSDKPKLENYLGLARHYARQYQGMLKEYPSLEYDDLYQECLIALNRACEAFDPSKNVKFEYIAAIWMKQAMVTLMQSKGGTVKVPFKKTVDTEDMESIDTYTSFTTYSLDMPEVDELELVDDDEADETAQQLILMHHAIAKLSEDDQLLLRLSFGLGNHKKKTYQEIADELGIRESLVRRKVKAAKKRLRELMNVEPPKNKKAARPTNYKLNNARRAEYRKDYYAKNKEKILEKRTERRLKKKLHQMEMSLKEKPKGTETQILKAMVKKMEHPTITKFNADKSRKKEHMLNDEQL